jgi:hypothetical protein
VAKPTLEELEQAAHHNGYPVDGSTDGEERRNGRSRNGDGRESSAAERQLTAGD